MDIMSYLYFDNSNHKSETRLPNMQKHNQSVKNMDKLL